MLMSQTIQRILTLLCLAGGAWLAQLPVSGAFLTGEQPTYRILFEWPSPPNDKPRIIRYDISVNRRLDQKDFEELICRVIKEREPKDYETLRLYFYYDLDEYLPDIGHWGLAQKNREHLLGSYTWNKFWAQEKGGGTLYIVRDTLGKELVEPQSVSFDHFKDCKN